MLDWARATRIDHASQANEQERGVKTQDYSSYLEWKTSRSKVGKSHLMWGPGYRLDRADEVRPKGRAVTGTAQGKALRESGRPARNPKKLSPYLANRGLGFGET